MNAARKILFLYAFFYSMTFYGQGSSYSNSVTIPLDGVVRTFPASGATGNNVLCTDNGSTSVTWFSFTTNASAHCPLIAIAASDSLPCEIAMYNSISGNINNNLETASSMCFDDGFGLWAPAETLLISGGKTYYLRIKTTTSCSISIAGQHYQPVNDDCDGAMSISTTPVFDNNACHQPGPGVSPDQLCAFTLENTAFYQFYVASTGNSIINISNITCDNGGINNSSGFQIGFFTGNCISLTSLSCTSGAGNFVQATSPPLPAGTKVYVAIDGNGGSNCAYTISGINVTGVLETRLKYFSIWERESFNLLAWQVEEDFNGETFIIERSENGRQFHPIGRVDVTGERFYQIEDITPPERGFYRIIVTGRDGKRHYSPIKELRRSGKKPELDLVLMNPQRGVLNLSITSGNKTPVSFEITSPAGQRLWNTVIFCERGSNNISLPVSTLPTGKYFISIYNKENKVTRQLLYHRQ